MTAVILASATISAFALGVAITSVSLYKSCVRKIRQNSAALEVCLENERNLGTRLETLRQGSENGNPGLETTLAENTRILAIVRNILDATSAGRNAVKKPTAKAAAKTTAFKTSTAKTAAK